MTCINRRSEIRLSS